MQGWRVENNHPTTNRTPHQTNKTGPRIDQQGKGKVFIPPTHFRLLQRQSEAYRDHR
ncbi:hypothetical protein PHL037M02_44 [Propionibacterium phage PHL037M02]|uniref:Uncharacterized protein n=2 Tax=Pahexavirus PHL037M02 TaxID=1982275 RepID=A0A0E3DMP1_9CAUD|nr:hypothetical protein PHL037M02_44 [Propionibacterium phage PHL037M02]YP_009150242.1 hypothetical protein ACQ76_gp43 [Propionibacterium phage PHL085N00]AGI12630.1 hypothetical protein PHL085M01_44 [Propionibacterium phage PHL085M01]AGI12675.1 hypothetical protein PHL115M02_44 [Propionibacterium phage PHL115M02]AGI12585.1 hypothetical protein PHL037M02_44 [Propionibacterium phage PHL037M02]AII29262.1 hypothetical protein PHL085N00_43 [Propionibacterium phage PHL085N00]